MDKRVLRRWAAERPARRCTTYAWTGMDATGLDGVTWHSCRHMFASRLVMAGVDLRTMRELGG